jgi:hypothetical protein
MPYVTLMVCRTRSYAGAAGSSHGTPGQQAQELGRLRGHKRMGVRVEAEDHEGTSDAAAGSIGGDTR